MKKLLCLIFCVVLLGCGSQDSTPQSAITTTPTTTNPIASLKAKTICSDTGTFEQAYQVSIGYSVIYTINNYSDGTFDFSCIFNSLYYIYYPTYTDPMQIMGGGKASTDSFIYYLRCPLDSPYGYSFAVAEDPARHQLGHAVSDAINIANCTTINY